MTGAGKVGLDLGRNPSVGMMPLRLGHHNGAIPESPGMLIRSSRWCLGNSQERAASIPNFVQ